MKAAFMLSVVLLASYILSSSSSSSSSSSESYGRVLASKKAAAPVPSPAPSPSPPFVNITSVIKAAGMYTAFLSLLTQTQQDMAFQAQANNTEIGITIFCPTDKAFAALPKSTLSNLTSQQKTDLVRAHALSSFFSLAALQQFHGPAAQTLASSSHGSSSFTLTIQDNAGSVLISTPYDRASITSTLYNADPASIFAIDKVLRPVEIFGPPAPTPAPAPAPSLPPQSSPALSPTSPKTKGSAPAAASGPASDKTNAASPSESASLMLSMALIVAVFSHFL